MEIALPNDFEPRQYQRRYMRYFDSGGKRACWVVHRRGGKDLTAMHQTCKMMHERKGAYWHIYPTAEQARKAIWEGFTKDGKRIMEQVFPREIRKTPKDWAPNAEMVVELKCGSVWRLLGSDKIEVVGAGPAGVVFSEYAIAKPTAWHLIRPMLRENGGWASFIYTPRGNNHGKELYDMALQNDGWFCELLTLNDTRAYDPDTTVAEERAEGMPEEMIQQEYFCDFKGALLGSYYGKLIGNLEDAGAITDFEHDTTNVLTSWDLGKGDSTAIWFWRLTHSGVDFIDHYEASGEGLKHYFGLLDAWADEKGYRYVKHWLPHDAAAQTLVTDQTIEEQCVEKWGRSLVEIVPRLDVDDGIQAVRWLLQQPVRFHPRCRKLNGATDSDGIECLKQYRKEWDEDKRCFKDKPLHDWTSHTADAMRYAAIVVKHVRRMLTPKAPKKETIDIKPLSQRYTMNDVWRETRRPTGRPGRI